MSEHLREHGSLELQESLLVLQVPAYGADEVVAQAQVALHLLPP